MQRQFFMNKTVKHLFIFGTKLGLDTIKGAILIKMHMFRVYIVICVKMYLN